MVVGNQTKTCPVPQDGGGGDESKNILILALPDGSVGGQEQIVTQLCELTFSVFTEVGGGEQCSRHHTLSSHHIIVNQHPPVAQQQ